MSLRSRLATLEKAPSLQPRMVVISAAEPGDEPPGSIILWDNGKGSNMVVPSEFARDPIAGLSDRQKSFIHAGDEVLALICATDPDEPGSLFFGEQWVTWPVED